MRRRGGEGGIQQLHGGIASSICRPPIQVYMGVTQAPGAWGQVTKVTPYVCPCFNALVALWPQGHGSCGHSTTTTIPSSSVYLTPKQSFVSFGWSGEGLEALSVLSHFIRLISNSVHPVLRCPQLRHTAQPGG